MDDDDDDTLTSHEVVVNEKEIIRMPVSSLDDHSSLHTLYQAKRELASKLREVVALKRELDDIPSHPELTQYEQRFAELNVQIQGKLRQTRKYFATFNSLMEIKGLMLKETSLLNSISSQFQDAITTPVGRLKLIDSLEAIFKGTQQKQEKVQRALLAEQKVCDDLRKKYAAAILEQRKYSYLSKALQEERAKNDMLRSRTS